MERREFLRHSAVSLGALSVAPRSIFGEAPVLKLGGAGDDPLQLNWNENPLGLAPVAQQAATEAVAFGHRYPDAVRGQFIEVLATKHRVETDSVVLGNGSTEILQIVTQAFAERQPRLVMARPTFSIILRYQRPFDYQVEQVPLDDRFAHDLGQMRAKAKTGPALIYLCNPNNPTGTLTPSQRVDRWIAESSNDVLFLIDEAYFDYVRDNSYWSASKWVRERENVVVTRTFSKIYGMAGMRLGYALAHPKTADWLRGFTPTDNSNGPALAAGLASIADDGWLETSFESNRQAKQITLSCLEDLGLEALPSHTNFVMHRIQGQLDLYIARMRQAGVRVGRPFPPMLAYNRLTLGLPEQMKQFAGVLREFREKGWI